MKTKKIKPVPSNIQRPDYAKTGQPRKTKAPLVKTSKDIKNLRSACSAARRVLNKVLAEVKEGVSTEHLDQIAHDACIAEGGYPSPLNYRGYPKSLCTSVNSVICHGIPTKDQILKDGDIINCDVTIYLNGMHGDCSETVCIGNVDSEIKQLVDKTREAMYAGIEALRPGGCVSDTGHAIQEFLRDSGYGIVTDFVGHGIGPVFHMTPHVPHFYDATYKFPLKAGMALTVEPMINLGVPDMRMLPDKWTAVTADGKPSAQFEHTVLITETGREILTQ